jgi:hypothetical protein
VQLPLAQAFPQPPQFFPSVFTSTQAPAQYVSVPPAEQMHWPLLQVLVAALQVLAHFPQCLGSFARSTHSPPHNAFGTGHVQLPFTHVSPGLQAASQLPQWDSSDWKSAQAVLHWFSGLHRQLPLTHLETEPQSDPSSTTPLQSLSLPSHTSSLPVWRSASASSQSPLPQI